MLSQAAQQPRGAALLALAQEQLPVSVLLSSGNAKGAGIHMMRVSQRPDMLLQALDSSGNSPAWLWRHQQRSPKGVKGAVAYLVGLCQLPHMLVQAYTFSRSV